eukprot:gene6780-7306_t
MSFQVELSLINASSVEKLEEEFGRCCGSPVWVQEMVKARPFTNVDQLIEKGNLVWWNLSVEEWQKAFAAHPKIGDRNAFRAKFAQHGWEGNEQSGTNTATEEVLEALEVLNNEYEYRNGFIFIICATGKSAVEMLTALKARVNNDSETEIQNAAGEQAKIIRLRLIKMLQSFTPSEQQLSKL